MIALDTETTGLDMRWGARPFFVTVAREDGTQTWWEWDIFPYDRMPMIPAEDREEIQAEIDAADCIVGQNLKFDIAMLRTIDIAVPFDKIEDTLILSHLLASNRPHDLGSLAMQYLKSAENPFGVDISPLEKTLEESVKRCQTWTRKWHKDWRLASKGDPMMPSAKEKTWSYDMWLPRCMAQELGLRKPVSTCRHSWEPPPPADAKSKSQGDWCVHCRGHRDWIVLADYSNCDSMVTLRLWKKMSGLL